MSGAIVGHRLYRLFVKRALDIFFSFVMLVILSPLLLVVSLFVRIKLGSPIVFKQQRPGKDGVVFNMYKFRTMLPPQTIDGRLLSDEERLQCLKDGVPVLSDEERLTSFGRMLRATSIDELPELINILKGDMSFVGPRPLAVIYLPYYTVEESRRHEVRPGLTGLAQVHGRNAAKWADRFRYDVDYVDDVSFAMDFGILVETIRVVLAKEGVNQGEARPIAFHDERQSELDAGTVSVRELAMHQENESK